MSSLNSKIESKQRELNAAQKTLENLKEKIAGIPESEREVKLNSDLNEQIHLVEKLQLELTDLELKQEKSLSEHQSSESTSNHTEVNGQRFEFVNRAHELELLCKPVRQQFVLLDAPAGYGKTVLLAKTADILRKDLECNCIFVNFETSEIYRKSKEELLHSMVEQITTSEIGPVDLSGLVNLLAGKLAGPKIRTVQLIFDSIDLLQSEDEEGLRGWLWDELIPSLLQRLSSRNIKLHALFSGRYIQNRFRGPRRHVLYTMQLTPFDDSVVLDLIQQVAKKQWEDYLPFDRATKIAKEIADITGGHPKCIVQIVQEIGNINFAVNLDASSKDYFFSKSQRERMVNQYIEPELRQILRGVDYSTQEALLVLSVFRRFNAETIDVLIRKDFIQWTNPASHLLANVKRTHLISDPTSIEPFYTDKVARRMLASKIKTLFPEKYYQLHQLAVHVYEQWGMGSDVDGQRLPNKPTDQYQVIFLIEILYHMMELLLLDNEKNENAITKLRERLDSHLARFNSIFGERNLPEIILQLEDAIISDIDLRNLMGRFVVENGFDLLFEPLNKFRHQ